MKARVARGDLGRILLVTGSYTQDWLLSPDDYNWRIEPDGGTNLRALADIGTHWMDLAQFLVGQPIESVSADLATFHPQRRRPIGRSETFQGPVNAGDSELVPVTTEDFGGVLFRMLGGIRGAFHVSQVASGRKNRLSIEISGTESSLAWDSESPEVLWLGHRGRPNEQLLRDPALLSSNAGHTSHYPGGHAEGFPDTFKQLYLAVYGWLGEGAAEEPPFPTFADGDRELRLCEAIAKSSSGGCWVTVAQATDDSTSQPTTM
jgi:predicted dehydrogenase